ncbi:hypothetical protein [[Phormidium] sp. ETS-05]|nr:hypothetical protein [[Phormidium] sp. ETS-05]
MIRFSDEKYPYLNHNFRLGGGYCHSFGAKRYSGIAAVSGDAIG